MYFCRSAERDSQRDSQAKRDSQDLADGQDQPDGEDHPEPQTDKEEAVHKKRKASKESKTHEETASLKENKTKDDAKESSNKQKGSITKDKKQKDDSQGIDNVEFGQEKQDNKKKGKGKKGDEGPKQSLDQIQMLPLEACCTIMKNLDAKSRGHLLSLSHYHTNVLALNKTEVGVKKRINKHILECLVRKLLYISLGFSSNLVNSFTFVCNIRLERQC